MCVMPLQVTIQVKGFRFLSTSVSGKFPISSCLFHLLLIPLTDVDWTLWQWIKNINLTSLVVDIQSIKGCHKPQNAASTETGSGVTVSVLCFLTNSRTANKVNLLLVMILITSSSIYSVQVLLVLFLPYPYHVQIHWNGCVQHDCQADTQETWVEMNLLVPVSLAVPAVPVPVPYAELVCPCSSTDPEVSSVSMGTCLLHQPPHSSC